jgi:hypothetical protein
VIPRYQLAVAPRITPASLLGAAMSLFTPAAGALGALASSLRREFGASECVLTDSGTSALVLALRLTAGREGTVALPGYGCVDLASAVGFAGLKARLYDVDPNTMSPDLDALEGALKRGVDAVVVAHYYGYPADVAGVQSLASSYGVPVIEDAAQAAGGALNTARLGALGDLSVLSFGRGKGLFGGRGGALLSHSATWSTRIASLPTLRSRSGLGDLSVAVGQWVLGRPELYAVPASIPWLHLGEMVYHPAHEPSGISVAAASLVGSALASADRELGDRCHRAAKLHALLEEDADQLLPVRLIARARPGYLRFAVIDRSSLRVAAPRLGVMRGYPRTLREQPELAPHLVPGEPATHGAAELRRSLFTLPTHSRVTTRDLLDLQKWISRVAAGSAVASGGRMAPSQINSSRARQSVANRFI